MKEVVVTRLQDIARAAQSDLADEAGASWRSWPRGSVTCSRCADVIIACRSVRLADKLIQPF